MFVFCCNQTTHGVSRYLIDKSQELREILDNCCYLSYGVELKLFFAKNAFIFRSEASLCKRLPRQFAIITKIEHHHGIG